MKKISRKILIAKMAFVLVGIYQIHAMEEGVAASDSPGERLPLISLGAAASRGIDGENQEYSLAQLLERMNADLANAAESGPRQADEIRDRIKKELMGTYSEHVCTGAFDGLLRQFPSLHKKSTNHVQSTTSLSLCKRLQAHYSTPYQKIVELKTEEGTVRGSLLPDGARSAIRIQHSNYDDENGGMKTFAIDKKCSCLAINASASRIAYYKENDGIYYRDLYGDNLEFKVLRRPAEHWIAVLALSPLGEKIAYCLARKKTEAGYGPHAYDGIIGAFVYDIASKVSIQLHGYDYMVPSPTKRFVRFGIPALVLGGGAAAALGAFAGYATTPEESSCKVGLQGVHICDSSGCREGLQCPWGEEDREPYTRLGAWVGATVGSSLACCAYLCSLCCRYRPLPIDIPPLGFADENVVHARNTYLTDTWDVALTNVGVEKFKRECYLHQIKRLEEMHIENVDKSTAKLVKKLLSSPVRKLFDESSQQKTKERIKGQAVRLYLYELI